MGLFLIQQNLPYWRARHDAEHSDTPRSKGGIGEGGKKKSNLPAKLNNVLLNTKP